MIPQKKTEIKNYALTGTIYRWKMHYQSQKGSSVFQIIKTQVMSSSQYQKERKTASTVTTTVFGKKIKEGLVVKTKKK